MGSRIENLRDYNKMRLDLQAMGGNLDDLYEKVGDIAVSKEAPKLMLKGGAIAVGGLTILSGLAFAGYKSIRFMKDRKLKIKNEPILREKFAETIKAESTMQNNNEGKNEDLKGTEN